MEDGSWEMEVMLEVSRWKMEDGRSTGSWKLEERRWGYFGSWKIGDCSWKIVSCYRPYKVQYSYKNQNNGCSFRGGAAAGAGDQAADELARGDVLVAQLDGFGRTCLVIILKNHLTHLLYPNYQLPFSQNPTALFDLRTSAKLGYPPSLAMRCGKATR